MIKRAFQHMFLATVSPRKAWVLFRRWRTQGKEMDVQGDYLFPAVGSLLLLAFVATVWEAVGFDVSLGLRRAVQYLAAAALSFYGCLAVLPRIGGRLFGLPSVRADWELFVFFSYAPLYFLAFLSLILSEFIFIYLLGLYTFYVVWEGCRVYWVIAEEKQLGASALFVVVMYLFGVIGFRGAGLLLF